MTKQPSVELGSAGALQSTAVGAAQPQFSKKGLAKGAGSRIPACLRLNEYNQYSDVCVSIINLLLLVQLFGTELISRALYQSADHGHEACCWLPSLAPSLARAAVPLGLPNWSSMLQEVALHATVIVLACAAPAAYAARWRCPLMLARRLLMPATNLLLAVAHEPSRALALELLGENRLVSTTVEVALHTVMYPVPFLWHVTATAARIAIQAALVLRFAPIQRYDPYSLLLQLLASFILPSALVFLTQHTFLSKRAPPAPAKLPPQTAYPTKTPSPVGVPPIVLPPAENVAAADAATAACGDDVGDAAAAAQRKQRRPPPRQRSLLAASESDSMVSPREAAAAAAAAAAGAAEVAVDAPRHSSRPPARRQRSMYKPRIRPALLISVKMHHGPDVNFDHLAPALRQSALKALHKYDCDSIMAPGASSSAAGPSTSAAGAYPTLSPLQVQSACIPGCVQLLIGAWATGPGGREGWLAEGQERGLAEALYRGVAESPEGRHLGRVVVQVGAAGFTFVDGQLVEEGTVEEADEVAATGSEQQCPGSLEAGAPQWVWPAWVPEASGDVQFACGGTAAAPQAAHLAGQAVRVVVAEGAAGRVLLDQDNVIACDDGLVRFTMAAPPAMASCVVFLLAPSGTLLASAPLLALPAACCTELDELLAYLLAGGVPGHPAPATTPPSSVGPPPTAALLALRPALSDLASGLLAYPPPTAPPPTPAPIDAAAAADAAATLAHLADYFDENDMLTCCQLAATCAEHLQQLALTPAGPPTVDRAHTAPQPPAAALAPSAAAPGAALPTGCTTTGAPSPAHASPPQPQLSATEPAPPAPATARKTADLTTTAATAPAPLDPAGPHVLPPAPPLGTLWGFSTTPTKEQYQQYKAVHASRVTDCLMAASCTISLAASVMFRSSCWHLWLAVDLIKVLQFALLLSAARPALWRWRDGLICATRASTALALAAATLTGWVPAANRNRVSLGIEAHVVMLVCGVLRPLLYQVSVSPAMLVAMACEALYAVLVYGPVCGLAPTIARCAVGSALGIAAALALDLRCRLHFLQLSRALPAAAPVALHATATSCAATRPAAAAREGKVKSC